MRLKNANKKQPAKPAKPGKSCSFSFKPRIQAGPKTRRLFITTKTLLAGP